tara:strand:+ start:44 stop:475 length:432 start_codon:yes stop_codon:yes gene_type:complete
MSPFFLSIILIPIVEIYLFIKLGSQIGAFTTISLIFATAIIGVYYAKYEGLNTLKSAIKLLSENKRPTYEIFSGTAIAIAAVLLIIPGFATDVFGFLIIFPITRRIIFQKILKKVNKDNVKKKDFIEGEYEDIDDGDNNDKKI